jgi:hypothetical protein
MTDFFRLSPKAADYKARLERFMAEHIYPNEAALFETAETKRIVGNRSSFWRS